MGGGGRGGGGGRVAGKKYNLTFSVSGRNVLNHVNPATPTGNLSSPLFGIYTQNGGGGFGGGGGPGGGGGGAAGNRRIDLQLRFSF